MVMAKGVDHVVEGLWPLVVNTEELALDPANARSHSRRNLDAIKGSLRAFKQRTPLVVQVTPEGDQIVRKGNGTLIAAREMVEEGDERWKQLAVVRVVEDHTTATGYAIADNRSAELAEWNDNLTQLLQSLADDDPSMLLATGFDDVDLEALVSAGSVEPEELAEYHQSLDLDLDTDQELYGKLVVICDLKALDHVRDIVQRALEDVEGVRAIGDA